MTPDINAHVAAASRSDHPHHVVDQRLTQIGIDAMQAGGWFDVADIASCSHGANCFLALSLTALDRMRYVQ